MEKTHIVPESIENLLGPAPFIREDLKDFDEVGVSTGLAWTSAGGEILHIESTKMKGNGLTLTGKLGDIMKESAQTALNHIRSKAKEYGVNEELFHSHEFHIHVPAGAIPKDGPSAGIALASSLVSLLTGLPVDANVAMTGEITLTGKVLPIGGLKEKALAALRMKITTVIIPWRNKKDLVEIPDEFRKKINFVPVKNFSEVLKVAIIDWDEWQKHHSENNSGVKKTTITPPPVAA